MNFCSTVNCGNVENEAPRKKSIGQKGRSQWTSIQNPQRCTQEEYGASEGPQWVSGNRQFLLKGTKSMDTLTNCILLTNCTRKKIKFSTDTKDYTIPRRKKINNLFGEFNLDQVDSLADLTLLYQLVVFFLRSRFLTSWSMKGCWYIYKSSCIKNFFLLKKSVIWTVGCEQILLKYTYGTMKKQPGCNTIV